MEIYRKKGLNHADRRQNVRRASLLYESVVLGVMRATCYVLCRNKAYKLMQPHRCPRARRPLMHNEFTAVIAPAPEGGYAAYCLEIPAVGEGETLEECRQNLREAILLMLTDRRET